VDDARWRRGGAGSLRSSVFSATNRLISGWRGPVGWTLAPCTREKGLVFRSAGFDVLRLTRYHVIYEPARVLVLLAEALARRRAA